MQQNHSFNCLLAGCGVKSADNLNSYKQGCPSDMVPLCISKNIFRLVLVAGMIQSGSVVPSAAGAGNPDASIPKQAPRTFTVLREPQ